jgi:hypothetical protein
MSQERIEHEIRRMVDEFPPPRPGLSDRVLAAVPNEQGGQPLNWAALAAGVLALAIIVTLVYGGRDITRRVQPAARPTAVPTTAPKPTPSLRPAPTGPPYSALSIPQTLSWTGDQTGSMPVANVQCPTSTPATFLFSSPDGRRTIGIDSRPPGTYSANYLPNPTALGVSLYFADLSGPGLTPLYLSTSGAVAIDPDGRSGRLDVWLGPQTGPHGAVGQPSIHLSGGWRCPPAP